MWLSGKEITAGDAGDMGSIPGLGRSPKGRYGNPLQYSCLENPKDRGACQAIVHKVTKSQIQLKQLSLHTHTHTHTYYQWLNIFNINPAQDVNFFLENLLGSQRMK